MDIKDINIEEYKDFKNKTLAEFHTAIIHAENLFFEKIKQKDIVGALEAAKLKLKLETLEMKKTADGDKNNYEGHAKSHK